ncbi:MAG TPA: MATE family efflux transporter [Candidatus Aphodomonas merdavium]|nr:MATE family efflux transporter [Candidatus Aphodomonas merdavium]
MKLQQDLTQGKVFPRVATFALPLILSSLLQNLYNTADMYFVGRYVGTNGLAAVSICGPIMMVLTLTLNGLSSGISVVLANYKGGDSSENVRRTGNTAIALYAVLALAATLLGQLFAPQILRLVRTPEESFPDAIRYLRVVFLGVTFSFGYNLISALQRGFGDSKSPLLFIFTASSVNVVLDYLFVGPLGWGAWGAALATVVAQGLSFLMGIVHFKRQRHVITFRLHEIRFYGEQLRHILRIGLPTVVNEIFVTLAMLTVSATANSFGAAASAAYGVGRRIDSFACITDGAMNGAMSAFVSQNVGAGRVDRARKGLLCAMAFSGGICLCIMPFVYAFAPSVVSIFTDDPTVIENTVSYMRLSVFSYLFFALVGPLIGFMRGSGNQMITVAVGLVAQYAFRVPTALLTTRAIGFPGIALAVLAGPLSSVTMYVIAFASGLWKHGVERMPVQSGKA